MSSPSYRYFSSFASSWQSSLSPTCLSSLLSSSGDSSVLSTENFLISLARDPKINQPRRHENLNEERGINEVNDDVVRASMSYIVPYYRKRSV